MGGFAAHAHLTGGDDDLLVNAAANGRNTRVCLTPESWVYSAPKTSWRAYVRQKRRHLSVGVAYRPASLAWLGLLTASHLGHYLGLVALIAMGSGGWALALYLLRMAVVWPRFAALNGHLRERDLGIWVPVLDAGVALYYVVFGGLGWLRRTAW